MNKALRAAAFGLLLTLGACRKDTPQSVGALAWIEDRPVSPEAVQIYLKPSPPRIGAGSQIDPRQKALDQAIREQLFFDEAQRRGLKAEKGPPALIRASLIRALIDQQMQQKGIRVEAISDQEAKAFYEQYKDRFNVPEKVVLQAIVLQQKEKAESVLKQAEGKSAEEFSGLVQRWSEEESTKGQGGKWKSVDEHGKDQSGQPVEKPIAVVAMGFRRAGEVGLGQGADGRYYVLRAELVQIEYKPWDRDIWLVKNRMVMERKEAALSELEKELRKGVRIRVEERALSGMAIPIGEE